MAVTYARPRGRPGRAAGRASSPRRSRRSCSCGCARPSASTGCGSIAIAPFATRGLTKLAGPTASLTAARRRGRRRSTALRRDDTASPAAVILVGERLATSSRCATRRRPGWPTHRRAAGLGAAPGRRARRRWRPAACPTCCPAAGRSPMPLRAQQVAAAWNVDELPADAGPRHRRRSWRPRPTATLGALLIGGVELADLPDPRRAGRHRRRGVRGQPELRRQRGHRTADVVFPVAPVVEKSGTFLNWEGRIRPFEPALRDQRHLRPAGAADRWPTSWASTSAFPTPRPPADSPALGTWDGDARRAPPTSPAPPPRRRASGEAVLASWRMLLDAGRLQDGEPHLAGTARPPVARLSAATAAEIGAADGRSGHRAHRPRRDHAAAGDHRHARPGGVAAAELPRLARCTEQLGVDRPGAVVSHRAARRTAVTLPGSDGRSATTRGG